MTTRENMKALLDRFGEDTILVVGDLMLDRYIYGSVGRISPEAPVPVVRVTREQARPGGAANVALNIRSLGGHAVMAGIVGADGTADMLSEQLARAGIETDGVVVDEGVCTTVKTRVVAERQQVVRVDRENGESPGAATVEALCARIRAMVERVDGVIVEDYGKGAINQPVVDAIVDVAGAKGIPVSLDPKENEALIFKALTLATPNYMEACAVAGVPMRPLGEDAMQSPNLADVAALLLKKWNCEHLFVTLGPRGLYLVSREGRPALIPTEAREVYDVSGAGDTVIAAATLALVGGADRDLAAAVANRAAGIVVGKLGTATCSAEELLAGM